jgi:protocatechuate 3,4-dioxygenase beta subunit
MKFDPRLLNHSNLLLRTKPTRRRLLGLLAGAGALPIIGCGEDQDTSAGAGGESSSAGTGVSGSSASGAGSSGSAGTPSTGGTTGSSTSWASGGTAAMTDKASYPNPFTESLSACQLVATTTEGPCTTNTDLEREDISEEWTGLPLRLGLKVIDTSCNVIAGATVKIWHTNLAGSYSGQTPNNGMCLKDQSYSSNDFFRGVQTTDDEGVVFFDSCFPGWYRGRAVHIHFQVKNGAESYRVSQLFFPEDITEEVFSSHDDYREFGQPDTTFSNDNIISGIATGERDRHILSVERMSDGVMLASKIVTVTG